MPELSEDLRTYFDELARRVEQDAAPITSGSRPPGTPRRSSALVPLLIGLVVILAVAGVVVANRRSSVPLDVEGSTTTVPSSDPPNAYDISVVPATGVLDGSTVEVHATGFAAAQMVAVVTCAGASADSVRGWADCDLETLWQGPAGADGVLDAAYPVRRLIRVSGAYDCGIEPRGCRIALGPAIQPPGGTLGGSVAITFAAGPATPLPAITMSPSQDLRDGQTVTVTGTHFAPGIDVTVMECPPNTDCGYEPFGTTARTDATGSFVQRLTLHRTFVVPANPGNGATSETLDCTTGCTINAVEAGPASNLSAEPLPFTLVG